MATREEVKQHETRSQAMADGLRSLLIALNTGGVGAVLATASSFATQGIAPRWAVGPLVLFVFGLAVVCSSMFLQKDKELARRDAAVAMEPAPGFDTPLQRNFTWDVVALVALVAGSAIALWMLYDIVPPMPTKG